MEPARFEPVALDEHALLDTGEGEKLERFGGITLVRPDPQAIWRRRRPAAWEDADLVFVRESDRGGRWSTRDGAPAEARGKDASWPLRFRDATFLVRPTPFKHVGVFPEQAVNWEWVRARRAGLGERPRLLNLFGYTGAASVLAVQAGYEVTHVDASKTSLAWLRDNLQASGLADDAVRIVLEDALAFARREARRGKRYEGILLDPPHYGRGPRGEIWRFEEGIAGLLEACAALVTERAFVVLSSYAIGTSPLTLANLLEDALGEGALDAGELVLPEAEGGRLLPCGFCARWTRRPSAPS
jgi:23S rRNA (cytosine1962-C5)-methyltransferase